MSPVLTAVGNCGTPINVEFSVVPGGQSRYSYALGDIAAAKFLSTQKVGIYSMADVLGL